jgi:hypothetical protein
VSARAVRASWNGGHIEVRTGTDRYPSAKDATGLIQVTAVEDGLDSAVLMLHPGQAARLAPPLSAAAIEARAERAEVVT